MKRYFVKILKTSIGLFVLTALILILIYLFLSWKRPPQTAAGQELFAGITYSRQFLSQPRPVMIHIVAIDLNVPGIEFFVTPPVHPGKRATSGETTSRLAARFDLQVAVNGSHFFPFRSETPWDYYPRRGEPVDVLGVAVSDHEPYSKSFSQWPKFCFESAKVYLCGAEGMTAAAHAISGQRLLVRRGSRNSNMQGPLPQEPLPRTAVGIDASGKKVWLVVVDGRQKNYSEGMSLFELGDFMQQLGAYYALNLDGGGSTTMVAEMDGRLKVLNAPYHVHIPMRERPVANALGVRVESK